MGAIGDAITAYAQPLIDETDGSREQVQGALNLAMMCWNIGILPQEKQQSAIDALAEEFGLDDAEFEDFKESMLGPMLLRYKQMFGQSKGSSPEGPPLWEPPLHPNTQQQAIEKPGRYDPCHCNSGKKYKFCCERADRAR
ncbi:SEC-C metal-binding domain-containing protein [Rhodopirellula sp. JC639]|uniref:SEC-C metal-binding domain-containing protein n=1 Tax=Stieleria mannarensis TaxID=2755585 RepID=UPI0015FFBEB5|nr:SEC-C metal-binding domain-containing protein [Rhodopirellula sp. JC639]